MTLSKTAWAFIVGFALAALLLRSPVVDAAISELMFGSYNGTATAIQVTSAGAVIVSQ